MMTLADLETLFAEIAAGDSSTNSPHLIIIHPDTYWRIRFAPYGTSKQRARLSAQVPRHRQKHRATPADSRVAPHTDKDE